MFAVTAVSSAAVTSHALALGPLLPGQTYHYRVVSSATGFASAVSGDFTFDTLPEPGVLRNPGFESQEAYWTRYGRFDDAGDNGIQGPGWYFSFNPRSGVNYAGSAASYDAKSGGFYQRVPVVQGRFYRFCAYSQTYVAGGDAANANNRVGIDPAGGTDSGSSSIVWSPRSTSGGWQQICVCARASSSYITVYLDAQQILPLEWNINAFDDCSIGMNTMLSPYVNINCADHGMECGKEPMRCQYGTYGPVVIGEDCWICSHVVILKGVTIGDGAVVAAGSVVNQDIPPYAIAAGVPAKVVGDRSELR